MIARLVLGFAKFLPSPPASSVLAQKAPAPAPAIAIEDVGISRLPVEARETIRLIHKGGPFPYARDGVTFSAIAKECSLKARSGAIIGSSR